MSILRGKVEPRSQGSGVAGTRLAHVESLIIERTGLPCVQPGTLNIRLSEPYVVHADAEVTPEEYGYTDMYGRSETIKLQRCVIRGVRAVIMRPDTHELDPSVGWGKDHIELMSHYHLRSHLDLGDNETVEVEVGGGQDWWMAQAFEAQRRFGLVPAPFSDDVRSFVESTAWTFAKTYAATWPHEYVVRTSENAPMILALAQHIFEHGTDERFYSQIRRYHHEGGKVFWSMDPTPEATSLVNRCDEADTYEARLAAGTLPNRRPGPA